METTGYVLRLCPFESLAFSGVSLTDDDLEAFIIVRSFCQYLNKDHKERYHCQGLENQTSILNATVCQREKFIGLIEKEDKLEHVEIPHWAGLGGVCYIPPELRKSTNPDPAGGEAKNDQEANKPDQEKNRRYSPEELQMINHRNLQLVNQLRTMDSAFSLGEGGTGEFEFQ